MRDEGDDSHLSATEGAQQREHLVDAGNQPRPQVVRRMLGWNRLGRLILGWEWVAYPKPLGGLHTFNGGQSAAVPCRQPVLLVGIDPSAAVAAIQVLDLHQRGLSAKPNQQIHRQFDQVDAGAVSAQGCDYGGLVAVNSCGVSRDSGLVSA